MKVYPCFEVVPEFELNCTPNWMIIPRLLPRNLKFYPKFYPKNLTFYPKLKAAAAATAIEAAATQAVPGMKAPEAKHATPGAALATPSAEVVLGQPCMEDGSQHTKKALETKDSTPSSTQKS